MYIKTNRFEGECRIVNYNVTPDLDAVLTIVSEDPHEPDFVRLTLPELGALFLKLIFICNKT